MIRRLLALAFIAAALLPAAPALAHRGDPSPSPLPIRGVTVDVRRHHGGPANYQGQHVESPFGQHGTPRTRPGHGRQQPRPTPTP